MKMRIAFFSLGLLLWGILPAAGALTVDAQVDRTHLAADETLNLTVTIKNGDGRVDVSAITDFKVISRGSSSNMQFVNGRTRREMAYNFLLIPRAKGRLRLPPLKVQSGGGVYHTQPITITVGEQPANGPDSASRNVFVEAQVSNSSPYVGQQITFTFRLYNAVHIANAGLQPPGFDGFTSKEVEDRRTYRKVINGREFAVIEVYYILVPLAPGAATIDAVLLQANIERPSSRNRRRSAFDRFFDDPFFNRGASERHTFQTEAIQIQVRPLPPLDKGEGFSGLVGRFELKADLDPSELKVGDSATLAVTIQGEGNIMDAQAIALDLPPTVKAYADSPEEKIALKPTGYSGQKTFRTALVPVQAGPVVLPPVQLTYFDVAQNSYQTLRATLPALTIAAADNAPTVPVAITPAPLGPLKKQVDFVGRDILPPKEELTAIDHRAPMGWGLFLLSLAAPALLFGATAWVQRLMRRDLSAAAKMKDRALKALKAARTEDESAFLTHLYQALTAAIYAAAGRTGQTLTWQEARTVLIQNGHTEDEAQQAAALLTTIESNKFSGTRLNEAQRQALLAQVKKMTKRLAP